MNRKLLVIIVSAVSACVVLCAVVGLAVALFVIVPRAQAKQLMAYTFAKGDIISQQFVMEQKITMTVLGQEQTVDQTIGMGYDLVVEEVLPDNSARLKCTYTWMKLKQAGASGNLDYETTTPVQTLDPTDEDFMGKVFGAMIGEGFSIVVTTDGRVIDLQGWDEFITRYMEKFSFNEAQKAQFLESMQGQLDKESMLETMGRSIYPYSQQPVKVGDTWKSSQSLSSTYAVIVDSTYKLVKRDADSSTIEVSSTVKKNPDGKPKPSGGSTVLYELEGDQAGKLVVDSSGWAVDGEIEQHLTGTVIITTNGKTMEIPMSLESVITLKTEHK